MGADVQFESEVDLRAYSNSTTRGNSNTEGMIRIPGGTFRMGSDKHYPEEAPVHRVTVGDFWIDTHPVTNRQFKEFVNATHHVTFAEIPPDPKDYPGALPHMLFASWLVFTPPSHPIDLRDFRERCQLAPPLRPPRATSRNSTIIRSYTSPTRMRLPMRNGPERVCQRKPSGSLRRAADSRMPNLPGAMSSYPTIARWRTRGR